MPKSEWNLERPEAPQPLVPVGVMRVLLHARPGPPLPLERCRSMTPIFQMLIGEPQNTPVHDQQPNGKAPARTKAAVPHLLHGYHRQQQVGPDTVPAADTR